MAPIAAPVNPSCKLELDYCPGLMGIDVGLHSFVWVLVYVFFRALVCPLALQGFRGGLEGPGGGLDMCGQVVRSASESGIQLMASSSSGNSSQGFLYRVPWGRNWRSHDGISPRTSYERFREIVRLEVYKAVRRRESSVRL